MSSRLTAGLGEQRQARLSAGVVCYYDTGGTGTPVVFVHGLLVSGAFWRHTVPPVARQHRCLVVELPLGGHRVAMDPDADLAPPAVADLLVELLDILDLPQVVLVGNDTGGAVCQLVAARHPERLAALVLTPCDAFDSFLPPVLRYTQVAARIPGALWVAAQALRFRAVQRLPIAVGWLARRPLPTEVAREYLAPSRDRRVRRDLGKVLRGISAGQTQEAARALAGFPRPVLLVWADTRKIFPVAHARRLAGLIPDAQLHVVPDSYAFVPEDQPQALVDALLPFLARLPEASSAPAPPPA